MQTCILKWLGGYLQITVGTTITMVTFIIHQILANAPELLHHTYIS